MEKEYVWYVCYGSNLNFQRFLKYIKGCTDKEEPSRKEPFLINRELYFAKYSELWGGGVAFLASENTGTTYGLKYLVTKEQYLEIKKQEGIWYQKEIYFGKDNEGIPMYSFTASEDNYEKTEPSQKYLDVISLGLKENYNLTEEEIGKYLKEAIAR